VKPWRKDCLYNDAVDGKLYLAVSILSLSGASTITRAGGLPPGDHDDVWCRVGHTLACRVHAGLSAARRISDRADCADEAIADGTETSWLPSDYIPVDAPIPGGWL